MARQAARGQRLAEEAARKEAAETRRLQAVDLRLALKAEREALRAAIQPGFRRPEDSRSEKELFLREKQHEAGERAAEIRERWRAAQSLLVDGLATRCTFFLDDLRLTEPPPEMPPPPELAHPAPRPAQEPVAARDERAWGLATLVHIGRPRTGPAEDEATRLSRLAAQSQWAEQERRRLERLTAWEVAQENDHEAFRLKQLWRAREIEAMGQAIVDGDPEAIAAYAALTLERSIYPPGFPRDFDIGFDRASGVLTVEMMLPDIAILPLDTDVQYIQSSNQIVPVPIRGLDRKFIYHDVIAMMALRTIHELCDAAVGLPVSVIGFNGLIARRSWEGGGPPLCVVSLRVTTAAFTHLDLAKVDAKATIRGLGGVIARPTDESPAVPPIVTMPARPALDLPRIDADDPAPFLAALERFATNLGFDAVRPMGEGDALRLVAFDDHPLVGGKVILGAVPGAAANDASVAALLDAMASEGAVRGILVSDGMFDLDAIRRAERRPVELIDRHGLALLARLPALPAED